MIKREKLLLLLYTKVVKNTQTPTYFETMMIKNI